MKIEESMCYARLVFMMCRGEEWEQAINNVTYTAPQFQYEGIAGYVDTRVTFCIKNLDIFTKLWSAWYSLPDLERLNWYCIVANKQGANQCS